MMLLAPIASPSVPADVRSRARGLLGKWLAAEEDLQHAHAIGSPNTDLHHDRVGVLERAIVALAVEAAGTPDRRRDHRDAIVLVVDGHAFVVEDQGHGVTCSASLLPSNVLVL